MCCENCKHYTKLPGMEKTGICEEDYLNKKLNIGVVMTSASDVCREWEADHD